MMMMPFKYNYLTLLEKMERKKQKFPKKSDIFEKLGWKNCDNIDTCIFKKGAYRIEGAY